MKFLATVLITAVTVHGVAIPEAEANPWCRQIGQPCWKVKRAAEAFAASLGEFEGLVDRSPEALRSHSEGGAAFMAKRGVDEIANIVAASQDDPVDYYHKLAMERRFAEDTTEAVRRDAEANPCRPGQACWKSEYPFEDDVDDDVDTNEETPDIERREDEDGSCLPGQACWKSEYPFEDDVDDEAETRDVHGEDKRWCRQIGQPCWRVRRAAEALVDAIGADEDLSKREFNPASKREAEPWCRQPGQPCWKRDADPEPWCRQIGQPCWKATRDLHAMKNVARAVIASLE